MFRKGSKGLDSRFPGSISTARSSGFIFAVAVVVVVVDVVVVVAVVIAIVAEEMRKSESKAERERERERKRERERVINNYANHACTPPTSKPRLDYVL